MKKRFQLYYFFMFYIIFLELVAHVACFKSINIGVTVLFSISFGLILTLFCSLFKKEKINKIISIVVSILIGILYCAQIIYYKMYESFFSFSAMLMAAQVTEGADQVATVTIHNLLPLVIAFIPVILSIIFSKHIDFKKLSHKTKLSLFGIILIVHSTALFIIALDKDGVYSNYQVYNNTVSPSISADRFGIITTMRLDVQKRIFGTDESELLERRVDSLDHNTDNKVAYNQTDINWEQVINNQSDKNIKQISTYFSNVSPTSKNEYTGIFKGKNVVFILGESLYKDAISKELTPTLYKMATEGFDFENYYVPLYPTSTADGEYMLEWSLYPVLGNAYNLYNSRNNFHPYGFVNTFSKLGYKVSAYHGFAGYFYNREDYFKGQGYADYGFCDTNLNMRCEYFHASDLKMVQNSINRYINEDKFFTYYVSISGHGKYDYDSNFIIRQNWDYVKDLDYSNKVKGYLAGTIELDRALGYMMSELEKAGKLDDTVFVLSPDHWPYYFKTYLDELEELAGDRIYDKFEIHRNTLLIYNSTMKESVKVDKLASSIDVLPTLLNLMGVDYDSRLLMGKDILSSEDNVVIFSNYSWITKMGKYDGKDFIPANSGVEIDENYIDDINSLVKQKILVSSLIQKNNYYKNLFNTLEQIKNSTVTESENSNE